MHKNEVYSRRSTSSWVPHGFSPGERESGIHTSPPPLKRWATHPSNHVRRITRVRAMENSSGVLPIWFPESTISWHDEADG